jgi:TfoX/Sxy family transcriptional regulator of competence genes
MSGNFQQVLEVFRRAANVEAGRMFGSEALKVRGKVFSMCVRNRLVVKLPAPRAKELIDSRLAAPFDPGHGRVMKEWVSIAPSAKVDWVAISSEAKAFVATQVKS